MCLYIKEKIKLCNSCACMQIAYVPLKRFNVLYISFFMTLAFGISINLCDNIILTMDILRDEIAYIEEWDMCVL